MKKPSSMDRSDARRPRHRKPGLHLMLDLDQILEALALDQEDVRRLDNVLRGFPDIVFTIHSDLASGRAIRLLETIDIRQPDHLLADSGMEVCHRDAGGHLVQDPDYREWLGHRSRFLPCGGAVRAIGLEYLEIAWATPRPLVATGRADRDRSLLGLAELPLLRPGYLSPATPLRIPQARFLALPAPGLSDTLRILLAFLASGRGGQPMRGEGRLRNAALCTLRHDPPGDPGRQVRLPR
jgi:hypothetical protein